VRGSSSDAKIAGLALMTRPLILGREGGGGGKREHDLGDARVWQSSPASRGVTDEQQLDLLIRCQQRSGQVQRVAPDPTVRLPQFAGIHRNTHALSFLTTAASITVWASPRAPAPAPQTGRSAGLTLGARAD